MRLTTRALRAAALALAAASIATAYACGCSDVGCFSSITVQVSAPDGTTPSAFSGEILVAGQSITFACPARVGREFCRPGGVTVEAPIVSDEEPESIRVTVTSSAGGTFAGDVQPEYDDFSPDNGPFCGPTCASGEVAVTLSR